MTRGMAPISARLIDWQRKMSALFVGYYATGAALTLAHPHPAPGSYALVEDTDSLWVWDVATAAWDDTETGPGIDTTAIHNNVAAEINALTLVTPTVYDQTLIEDQSDTNKKKKISLGALLNAGIYQVDVGTAAAFLAAMTELKTGNYIGGWIRLTADITLTSAHNVAELNKSILISSREGSYAAEFTLTLDNLFLVTFTQANFLTLAFQNLNIALINAPSGFVFRQYAYGSAKVIMDNCYIMQAAGGALIRIGDFGTLPVEMRNVRYLNAAGTGTLFAITTSGADITRIKVLCVGCNLKGALVLTDAAEEGYEFRLVDSQILNNGFGIWHTTGAAPASPLGDSIVRYQGSYVEKNLIAGSSAGRVQFLQTLVNANQRTITANDAVVESDMTVWLDGTANTVDLDLPSAILWPGRKISVGSIKDTFATTVTPFGAETINGEAGAADLVEDILLELQSNGANWRVV